MGPQRAMKIQRVYFGCATGDVYAKRAENDSDESPEAQSTSDVEDAEDYRKGACDHTLMNNVTFYT
jgi:hypothetical protein